MAVKGMEIQGGEMSSLPGTLKRVFNPALSLWMVGDVGIPTLSLGLRAVSLGHGVTEPC